MASNSQGRSHNQSSSQLHSRQHQRRAFGRNSARDALRRFQTRDLRDLQVWFNLTWVHPLAVERDDGLRALRDKGRNFTEEDREELLAKHLEILRQIVPLHKQLADSGQVELTTNNWRLTFSTPFSLPIWCSRMTLASGLSTRR